MNKKIVVIGANSFQNKLIMKAKSLGFETHVFAWQCGDVGEKSADYFYPVSIIEKDRILEECKRIKPDAVCTIASDLASLTVNYVARALNLNANSEECDRKATNKYEMREAFAKAGLPTPKHKKVYAGEFDEAAFADFRFPVIVKPTDRSGSRAITKIFDAKELLPAIDSATSESFENAAIVEEFIEGNEFSCESISFNGEHHILAVTEKYTTGAPHFIETGHIEPAPLDSKVKEKLYKLIPEALDALDIKNSAGHTEFKVDKDGNIGIIEIGARMGGDCIGSDLVSLSTGFDFVKGVIDVACGKNPMNNEVIPTNRCAAIRFIMNEQDLAVLENARKSLKIEDETPIDENINDKVVDSSSRHGYFIVTDMEYEKLKKILFD